MPWHFFSGYIVSGLRIFINWSKNPFFPVAFLFEGYRKPLCHKLSKLFKYCFIIFWHLVFQMKSPMPTKFYFSFYVLFFWFYVREYIFILRILKISPELLNFNEKDFKLFPFYKHNVLSCLIAIESKKFLTFTPMLQY